MADTTPAMTPTQRRTFDELLAIGADRPVARPGLVDELRDHIRNGTAAAVEAWTEKSLFLSKSMLIKVRTCEGQALADAQQPPDFTRLSVPLAAGQIAHRAIQLSHTHKGQPAERYVRSAISAARRSEERFAQFWDDDAGDGEQSDVIVEATNKVNGFLTSWPDLKDNWSPRFEEKVAAAVGGLRMSARVDLILGNPRVDGRQTMLIADWKTGDLSDRHYDEASFYGLVAALRHGVPPWRSLVYSLASGEWTEPDITEGRLWQAADAVVDAACRQVAVLTEQREPQLTGGPHCRWCPLKDTCPASEAKAA